MSGSAATIFICVSCKTPDLPPETVGRALFEGVTRKLAEHPRDGISVTAVECLAVCKRPCTVALSGAGKWTYVVGDLDPESHPEDVIAAAISYQASSDGIVPWRQRPVPFRKGIVARVPPLNAPLEGSGG